MTIDCEDPDLEGAVAFWSGVFGHKATKHENHYVLETPNQEVRINIQAVEHSPRVHLDIETDDINAEVARLEALGAARVRKERRRWVMEAPTGHRSCVVQVSRAGFEKEAMQWD